ncbi:MAG: hypothetical protein FJ011_15770 [Chloroflexi bacterium]|nr:hypothetical protein [Chloroflexota bacterium]
MGQSSIFFRPRPRLLHGLFGELHGRQHAHLLVFQSQTAAQIALHQRAHDLQPQGARRAQVEGLRQRRAIVPHLQPHHLPEFHQPQLHLPALTIGYPVLQRVLRQLVNYQRARRRLLAGQQDVRPLHAENHLGLWPHEHLDVLADDALADIAQVEGLRAVQRQEFMDQRHAQDARRGLVQDAQRLVITRAPGLHSQHAGDRLQVVLDPMVHFLNQGGFDFKLDPLALFFGGVVDQDQRGAGLAQPALPHQEAL